VVGLDLYEIQTITNSNKMVACIQIHPWSQNNNKHQQHGLEMNADHLHEKRIAGGKERSSTSAAITRRSSAMV
jgi:hypothetical protein